MLEFDPRRERAKKIEENLVASHMRIVYSVQEDRDCLYSGYPSEPILAEAAARQMNVVGSESSGALETLGKRLTDGILNKGEHGELVARFLVTLAYDKAAQRAQEPGRPRFSRPVSVIHFIEELFQPDVATKFLDSFPNNVGGREEGRQSFRDRFSPSLIRFTHFLKMGSSGKSTAAVALGAFIRGAAIICRTGEKAVDFILPVLLDKADGHPLRKENMSGLFFQVKNRAQAGSVANYEIDERTLGFFPQGAERRTYVSIVMELAAQQPAVPTRKRPGRGAKTTGLAGEAPASPSGADVIQGGKHHHQERNHTRYSIFAYGCTSTVYKVVDSNRKATYKTMLGARNFIDEHPREHGKPAVLRMKPFFNNQEESWHWLPDSELWEQEDVTEEGGVLIGDETANEVGEDHED